jgi:hexulose-6-phosphate isomerase
MQGRLSPLINKKIQAFPVNFWRNEFPIAERLGIRKMEWTLDYDGFNRNPLLTKEGQKEILMLCSKHNISIPSLTGDCFMQEPFWKEKDKEKRESLKKDFFEVVKACVSVNIKIIVIPLVDNGKIENDTNVEILLLFMLNNTKFFQDNEIKILFESELIPKELARFISNLPKNIYGINYDIGNSSSLGFDPEEEFFYVGDRILNVHVKDRLLGGTTVPLGKGNADFPKVFKLLNEKKYTGNYILQTARAKDESHAEILETYIKQTEKWITGENSATRIKR